MSVLHYTLGGPFPAEVRGGCVTLGNFDGVHVGHQALVAETVRQARRLGGPAIAVTFDPPPGALLRPNVEMAPLTPIDYRCALLQEYGIDHALIVRTTSALLELEARDFFRRILHDGFQARAVVEGFNFGFGKNRTGSLAKLEEWGREVGMTVAAMPATEIEGSPVSSSRIRADLNAGNVTHARTMLGRPYRLFGRVGVGAKRGRTIGFPTANLEALPNLAPGNGVYAVRVLHAGNRHDGAAHLGPNATFGVTTPSVEVHLLDFDADLYGQELAVDFIAQVRGTQKFATVEALARQIAIDVASCRQLLSP
ncbi:MAG TPA: bifunctional riboflavin kinase/FAD synthetase [Gemmataceae bacterium]|nr:bifunctional riboflavin kinase/FAD synthetase [Gemmataceae bacterium]